MPKRKRWAWMARLLADLESLRSSEALTQKLIGEQKATIAARDAAVAELKAQIEQLQVCVEG